MDTFHSTSPGVTWVVVVELVTACTTLDELLHMRLTAAAAAEQRCVYPVSHVLRVSVASSGSTDSTCQCMLCV